MALEIKNLLITYSHKNQTTTAVDHVSFSIPEGEFFGLIGPNGAGKTSIISAITSLVSHQAGEISVFGHHAGSVEAKRLVGYVPQGLVGYGFFNVNEILQFTSGYFGIKNNQKKIDELLERLQLTSYKYKLVSQLSGGLKRRMLIAKSLLHSPKILLLDEPSAGVDVELRTILWNFATELNDSGMTILLTTHYLEEADRLCKRVAIMNKGKILALDKTDRIKTQMGYSTLEEAFLKLIKQGALSV
ncbi:MAG: transporter ATP-binding protein [Bacteriovoracaceae bacterium]|nr:transporter ATP-binding protein [Bacteriovoracaceae bacterium]